MWAFRSRAVFGGIVSAALHGYAAVNGALLCAPKMGNRSPEPIPAASPQDVSIRTVGMATEAPYRRQVPKMLIPGPADPGFPKTQWERRDWLSNKLDVSINYRRMKG